MTSINFKLNKKLVLFIATVSAIIGTIFVVFSRAAGPLAQFETESGQASSGAEIKSHTAASGGSLIQFGTATLPSISQIPSPAFPTIETQTFSAGGDIADDSAIYANPTEPSKSVVIADNKDATAGGVGVFNMQGQLLQFRQDGKIGNIDLRTGFTLGNRAIVIVGANNRSNNTMTFWEYNPDTQRLSTPLSPTQSTISPNYGFCLYHSAISGKYYAFVSQETGSSTMEQYELNGTSGQLIATKVRSFNVGSITEGCAADDELGIVYVGQEDVALWRYSAEPNGGSSRTAIGTSGDGHLTADIEGIAIAKGPNNTGYIVVSSQGDSRYAIYDRMSNAFQRNFTIGANGSIDAVTETDGLDISTANLGPGFTYGALIVHDGSNTGSSTSNLKFVPLTQN